MRTLGLLLVLSFIVSTTGWIVGQSDEGARRPLDLPSGGAGDGDDEEDAPRPSTSGVVSMKGMPSSGVSTSPAR